ncbi:MAG: ATP-binding protein [Acidobacteriota bacterium]
MLNRLAQQLIEERLASVPAVALVGPRQSGKTTLARLLSPRYYDLEQESERLRLDLEWDDMVSDRQLVVLDEAQAWPEIFSRLRGAIDQDRKRNGRFLLLGSIAPSLMTQVSESLAGRLSLIELTPLLWSELTTQASRDRLWLCGGFPDGGVLTPKDFPRWQMDYLALLAQRDLPNWGLSASPQVTQRLLSMLAAGQGQLWNASQIAQSFGLTYHTINRYLDYFAGAFLVRRLPPYLANLRKRLARRPKLYWRDSGLLHALLSVPDRETLLTQSWVGASWEGFVIEQTLGVLSTLGVRHQAFHFRTSDQYEIDLVLELGAELWAIETKLTTSPGPGAMRRLDHVAEMIGATHRFLISQTREPIEGRQRTSCNLEWFVEHLLNRFGP